MASSGDKLEAMLADLVREAGKVGLDLHDGKTKCMCNRLAREHNRRQKMQVQGQDVGVIKKGATSKCLGREPLHLE